MSSYFVIHIQILMTNLVVMIHLAWSEEAKRRKKVAKKQIIHLSIVYVSKGKEEEFTR